MVYGTIAKMQKKKSVFINYTDCLPLICIFVFQIILFTDNN